MLDEAVRELGEDADTDHLCDAMELGSIKRSLERLMSFPFISEAVQAGTLTLHGARFGIADGELEWLHSDGRFAAVSPDNFLEA